MAAEGGAATNMNEHSKILLPLDTDTGEKALALAAILHEEIYAFKVGLELVNAAGFELFEQIKSIAGPDVRVFYDCKFHDIPNTVAGATRAAARRGVWMLNVHASGGGAMMRAAVQAATEGAEAGGHARPLVLAVTVLTSLDATMLKEELGVAESVSEHVVRLARLAQDSGCDGVVASPFEVEAIRAACGPDFQLVIPGVRPAGSAIGDQKRVMTPGEAMKAGADYLVVGRPITAADDPVAAARVINAEVSKA
jgi:orotidine-5'-phosphate decarboxylase